MVRIKQELLFQEPYKSAMAKLNLYVQTEIIASGFRGAGLVVPKEIEEAKKKALVDLMQSVFPAIFEEDGSQE